MRAGAARGMLGPRRRPSVLPVPGVGVERRRNHPSCLAVPQQTGLRVDAGRIQRRSTAMSRKPVLFALALVTATTLIAATVLAQAGPPSADAEPGAPGVSGP